MFHRINRAQPVIWRDPNTLQVGLDKEKVILQNLTLSQQQIFAALYTGLVDGQQDVLDSTYKAGPGTTQSLIEKLSSVIEKSETLSNKFGPWQQLAFAELARAAIDYQVNPEMVMAERWARVVHIDQLDKAGVLLTKGLLASGVGKVVTHDYGRVLNTDLGELGFPMSSLGKSRFDLTKNELVQLDISNLESERLVDLNEKTNFKAKISLAVLVSHLVARPGTYSRWMNRDVPHLNISFELNETRISPIVIPGETPCLNCLAEQKVDEDSAWPVIASQLLELPKVRDDSSSLLSATGLALRSILRHLDASAGFRVPESEGSDFKSGYRIEYLSGNVLRTSFGFHELCGCRNLN